MAWFSGREDYLQKLLSEQGLLTPPASTVPVPEISEADFQEAVVALARQCGWRVAHFRKARTKKGWRTPVAADGKGFPDLLMVRAGRLVFAELKSATGKASKDQAAWLEALGELVPCCEHCRIEVQLWRPSDWPTILEVLESKPEAT